MEQHKDFTEIKVEGGWISFSARYQQIEDEFGWDTDKIEILKIEFWNEWGACAETDTLAGSTKLIDWIIDENKVRDLIEYVEIEREW